MKSKATRTSKKPVWSDEPVIHIVLATYNGGRFLDEQLQSLRDQSYGQWRLILGDDGSEDFTHAVAQRWARFDSRIELAPTSSTPLGPAKNFGRLMQTACDRGAQWVALCDQDDVWLPEKLSRQVDLINQLECQSNDSWLLHGDLRVVDESLDPLAESFVKRQRLTPTTTEPLARLLVQNFVTGCTCLLSRGLLQRALPLPPEAVMHDWWLALIAASTGRLLYDERPTVLYRQHSTNQVGCQGYWNSINPLTKRWTNLWQGGLSDDFRQTLHQAARLGHRMTTHPSAFPFSTRLLVQRYLDLFRQPQPRWTARFQRVLRPARLGIRRQDWLRQLYLSLRLALLAHPVGLVEEMECSPTFAAAS